MLSLSLLLLLLSLLRLLVEAAARSTFGGATQNRIGKETIIEDDNDKTIASSFALFIDYYLFFENHFCHK